MLEAAFKHIKLYRIVIALIVIFFCAYNHAHAKDGSISDSPLGDKCLSDLGNIQNAEKEYDDILNLNPSDKIALYCRGLVRGERGSYQEAVDDFTTLIEIEPTVEGYLGRADAWLELGEDEKAELDLSNAFKAPGNARGYYISAIMLQSMARYQDAIIDYKKSIEIEPDRISSMTDLAWLYATCEDASSRDGVESLNLARRVIVRIDGPKESATLAAAYAELGDFDNARLFQEKAVTEAKTIYGSDRIQYFQDMLDKFNVDEAWREPIFPISFVSQRTDR